MSQKVLVILLLMLVCSSLIPASTFSAQKRMPRPEEFGNVVINNYSEKNNIAPVVFKHWVHRTRYTCRVCHVDIGFAISAGGSDIREEDNLNRLYCGSCHNGKEAFGPTRGDSPGSEVKNCSRCHSLGREVKFQYDFSEYLKDYPPARFGNRVDWMKAEQKHIVTLKDQIQGISFQRQAHQDRGRSTSRGIPDINFSHQIHADGNGCELCHPEIFGAKKGVAKYNMQEIFGGRYCGACHAKVAFPFYDCQLCHLKEVY